MFKNLGRVGSAAILVSVVTLGAGGCVRHGYEADAGLRTGSIKDAHAGVAKKVRKPVARTSQKAPASPVVKAAAVTIPAPKPLPPLAEAPKSAPMPAAPMETGKPSAPSFSKAPTAPSPSSSASTPSPASVSNGSAGVEAALPPTEDPALVAELLAEGQALFEAGQVVQARRRFIAAMNGPVPEVLLSLARSYDTYYLGRLPSSDAAPDMQRSLVLYERALARGAKTAEPDLERTRNILKVPR